MILYDRQVQGDEIRAEGRGRKDLFLLNDKSQVHQVEGGGGDMGDGNVIQGRARDVNYFLRR